MGNINIVSRLQISYTEIFRHLNLIKKNAVWFGKFLHICEGECSSLKFIAQ